MIESNFGLYLQVQPSTLYCAAMFRGHKFNNVAFDAENRVGTVCDARSMSCRLNVRFARYATRKDRVTGTED